METPIFEPEAGAEDAGAAEEGASEAGAALLAGAEPPEQAAMDNIIAIARNAANNFFNFFTPLFRHG